MVMAMTNKTALKYTKIYMHSVVMIFTLNLTTKIHPLNLSFSFDTHTITL